MAVAEISVAAATAVLGYDLMANSSFRSSTLPRRIRAIGLAGSAAAGDTRVSVRAGQMEIADIYNSATGFPTRDHLKRVDVVVPANTELHAVVTDAPATNPINLMVEFDE